MNLPEASDTLRTAIQGDPELAWAWHCNIAVPIMDVTGSSHKEANEAAAYIMFTLFGCDITTHPHYQYGKAGVHEYAEMRIASETATAEQEMWYDRKDLFDPKGKRSDTMYEALGRFFGKLFTWYGGAALALAVLIGLLIWGSH